MTMLRTFTTAAALAGGLLAAGVVHDGKLGPQTAAAQGAAAPAGPKLGYIRGQDILAQTPGAAELQQRFQKEVDSARAQEKVWGDSMNALVGDYAKQEAGLSADAKTARQAQLREKQASFQQRGQQLEQQVQQDNQRLIAPILQRVNGVLEQMRNEGNYAFIFDIQGQGGTIVAADKNLDLTDQVIARLRAMGPVSSSPLGPTATTPSRTGPTATPSGLGRPRSQ